MLRNRGESSKHDTFDPRGDRERAQPNHSHLDNFLRDQVLSHKSVKSKAQRSSVSVASRSNNASFLELAASNKYNQRKKSMVVGSKRHDTSVDTQSLVNAANVMRTSNY